MRQAKPPSRRLIARHGDAQLTDLLQTLAGLPKARSASIHHDEKWRSTQSACREMAYTPIDRHPQQM
jgi:hypothetical protein